MKLALGASLALLVCAPAQARDSISISFDELDARQGPTTLFNADAFYLYNHGISPFGWSIGTEVVVVDGTHAPGNLPVLPFTADNFITQFAASDEPLPERIGMVFDPIVPVQWFGFTRCAFFGSPDAPFTHPGFSVWGYSRKTDQNPTVVADFEAVTATGLVPAMSLRIPAIGTTVFERIIVWSHTMGASTPGVCMDQIMMQSVPAPGMCIVVGLGTLSGLVRRPNRRSA